MPAPLQYGLREHPDYISRKPHLADDAAVVRVIEPQKQNLRKHATTSTALAVALGFQKAADTVHHLLTTATPRNDQDPNKPGAHAQAYTHFSHDE